MGGQESKEISEDSDDEMDPMQRKELLGKLKSKVLSLPKEQLVGKTLLITAMGGALCPVHTMHVEVMEKVRDHYFAANPHVLNVFGVLVGSADTYVSRKLKEKAISWSHRKAMLDLALRESDWLHVYPCPEINGHRAGADILREAESMFPEYTWALKMVCGADTALNAKLWAWDADYICCGRDGYHEKMKQEMQMFYSNNEKKHAATKVGGEDGLRGFVVVDTVLRGVSSTAVREDLLQENWQELGEVLHKDVLGYLQLHKRDIYPG